MIEVTNKLATVKQEFEASIYGTELIWKEGEIVWIGGSDAAINGMVTICKFDKPFATYIWEEWIEEFIIEWQKIR
jgi:hypothetical protein